jgi:hypothetical protein
MSPRPPSPLPSDGPKGPVDDFDWPPEADDLAVYELDPEPWRGLQEASIEAFAVRHGEIPRRHRHEVRQSAQRLAGVLTAAAIVAAAAGWAIYRAASAPLPVEAGYRPPPATPAATPAPSVAPRTRPPDITIIATYPVEPARSDVTPGATVSAPAEAVASADASEETPAAVDADRADTLAVPPAPLTASADVSLPDVVGPAPAPVEIAAAPSPVAPAPAVSPATSVYRPHADIRTLLQRYEQAYDHRDVQTAATLWPSLDQRALTRAFASLDRQDVSFDRCDIDASEERGSAVCVGTVRYVPSVGRGVEKEGRITWTFDLTRSGEDWRIAKLSAR